MKTAFYQPSTGVLVNIQERSFHRRDMHDAITKLVQAARRMFGSVPEMAFCVWDASSVRIYPMNEDKPPAFETVVPLVKQHGYRE